MLPKIAQHFNQINLVDCKANFVMPVHKASTIFFNAVKVYSIFRCWFFFFSLAHLLCYAILLYVICIHSCFVVYFKLDSFNIRIRFTRGVFYHRELLVRSYIHNIYTSGHQIFNNYYRNYCVFVKFCR